MKEEMNKQVSVQERIRAEIQESMKYSEILFRNTSFW